MKKYFNFLDGFRGVLCIWIVLFHFTTRYKELYGYSFGYDFGHGGGYGVMLFFTISGFLTMFTASKIHQGAFYWLKRKFSRIYPQFALSVILIFIALSIWHLPGRNVTLTKVITDLFLFPAYFFPKIEGAHWYVITLLYFYIFFLCIARFKLHTKLWFYILCSIIFIVFYILPEILNIDNTFIKAVRILCDSCFHLGLFLGMLLYMSIYDKNKIYDILFFILLLVLAWREQSLLLSSLYLILNLLFRANDCKIVNYVLGNKLMRRLGGVSYSWYLIHQNIGYLFISNALQEWKWEGKTLVPIFAVLFTLILAFLFEALYNFLRELLVKRSCIQ